jgi:predicted aspartyl protease
LQVRQQAIDVEALLDTGFDGAVVVPDGLISSGLPPDGYLPWVLADGSQVSTPAYVGAVRVGQMGPFPVVVITLGSEPIVGCGLISRFNVVLDHGQHVIVEP